MSTPHQPFADALTTGDAALVAELLAQHPALKEQLNDPLPGGAFGATPLLHAVQHGHRHMVEVLLDAGADINQRSHWWAGGFGVLDHDNATLAPFLIERGAFVDAYAAARLGMIDRLRDLIAADPGVVHVRGGDGQMPLHVASNVAIADLLLEHSADIDAIDVDHESTAAQYLLRSHPEIARHLVSRGCRTDILMLCALGDLDRVRQSLDADPGAIRTEVSAEYFPMSNPHAGGTIYQWVLGRDRTPLLVAREFGHDDVLALLMARSPDDVKLAYACEAGDAAFSRSLAARRAIPASLSARERRQLPGAAERNNVTAVRLLLEAGWPVEADGQHGATALHWAAWHGNTEMAREVLKHNPPLEAVDAAYSGTPLGWTLHGSLHGWHRETGDYEAVLELLLDAGAQAPAAIDKVNAAEPLLEVLRRRGQGDHV
jgi:ankyrin repeat protein